MKRVVNSCPDCQRVYSKISYCHLCPIKTSYPFQMISLDTGHIPYGQDKNHYFVVAIDYFTRWIEIKLLKRENSEEIIQFIKDSIIYCSWLSG